MGKYFAGIEGGATHSTAILLDENGKAISELTDEPPTNHWILGLEECSNQILRSLEKLKSKAGLPSEEQLSGLGLCLSGCEETKTNEELKSIIKSKLPNIGQVEVESDTVGPLYAASDAGGCVLIAGTGSNCLLINPDKTQARCGGLGHLLGDEGAAWWIAHKAVKYCIKERDNYEPAPQPTTFVWNAIKEHFKIEDSAEMLQHCYTAFNKPFYAELTLKLAHGADAGDELCKLLFSRAGEAMAKHVLAVLPKVAPELLNGPIGLPVVCIGSVWKSWKYMEPGFLGVLGISGEGSHPKLTRFSLIRLTVSSALGAALLSAPAVPRSYSQNFNILYSFGV